MTCKLNHLQLPEKPRSFLGEMALFKFEQEESPSETIKNLSLAKEAAIRHVVKKLNPQIPELNTAYNHHHLIDSPQLLLSISHTKNLLLVIVADSSNYKSIGVDLEYADRKISPRTSKYFVNKRDQVKTLLKLWTEKEAAFKACAPLNDQITLLKQISIRNDQFSAETEYPLHGSVSSIKVVIEERELIISLATLS